MQKFKPINNDQLYLLPPNVEDLIPGNHPRSRSHHCLCLLDMKTDFSAWRSIRKMKKITTSIFIIHLQVKIANLGAGYKADRRKIICAS
jgi:hypothetical protein